MADIESTLSGILSDPEAVKKLQDLGKSLGLTEDTPKPASSPVSSITSLLSSGGNDSPDLTSKLGAFLPIISKMNQEDDTTALLRALRPFLSESRQKRLDDASKMLRVMHILPLINSAGLF